MTLTVADVELQVFGVGNDTTTPDLTIPNEDIEAFETTRRVGKLKDVGSVSINNTHRKYASDDITTGDRLLWRTQLEGESGLSDRWTAVAGAPERTFGAGNLRSVEVPLRDFVFAVLDWRQVYNAFEATAVSGSSDAILETVLANEASEIGRSQIQSVGASTDYFASGTSLLEVVGDLAAIGDAIIYNDGRDLVFRPIGDISTQWELQRGQGGDVRTGSVGGSDDELANVVRVDGGTSQAVDDSQTTQSSYTTVTDSSQLTHQLTTRKSEVDRIELWTRTTGSGEQMTVRLQKDDGGAPVAPGDRQSDIVNKTLDAAFLADADYTTFLFATHTLPEPNPWLIVETNGSTGQEVGVDSNGTPTYKAYYPYPLDIRTRDTDSISEYRRRETRIHDDGLETLTAAQETGQSTLRHRNAPRSTISAPAHSQRAHNLSPGDAVEVSWSLEGAQGAFVCTEIVDSYDGIRLESELTFQQQTALRQA